MSTASTSRDRAAMATNDGIRKDRESVLLLVTCAAALAVLLLRLGLRAVRDPDAWLHLRVGTFLMDGGRFGLPDPWATQSTVPYVANQWLPEVVGAWVYGWAGLPGIAVLRLVGIAAVITALLGLCRKVADPLPAALGVIAATLASFGSFGERPQILGVLFLVMATSAWWGTMLDGRPRWWLVPMTWLWACSHGLWIVGIAVGCIALLGMLMDHRGAPTGFAKPAAVLVLSAATAAITPVGPKLLWTPFQVNNAVSDFVQEWQATTIRSPFLAIFVGSVVALVFLWLTRPERTPPSRMLFLLAAVAAAFWMGRLVIVGAVLLAPLLAESLQSHRKRPREAVQLPEFRIWASAGAVTLVLGLLLAPRVAAKADGVPTSLLPALERVPDGATVMVDHGLSGWLIWERPQVHPTLDLRSEIYPRKAIEGYLRAVSVRPGWDAYLRSTNATYALMPVDSPLALALQQRLAWREEGRGQGFVLLRSGS